MVVRSGKFEGKESGSGDGSCRAGEDFGVESRGWRSRRVERSYMGKQISRDHQIIDFKNDTSFPELASQFCRPSPRAEGLVS